MHGTRKSRTGLAGLAFVLALGVPAASVLPGCTAAQQVAQQKNATPAEVATGKRDIERSLETLVSRIDPARSYSEQERYALLQATLEKNSNLFGAAWAVPASGELADVYYVFLDDSAYVTRADPGVDTADPAYHWFRKTLAAGSGGWSQPYQTEDHAGNRLTLVTYSLPVRKAGGGFGAVVACDYLIRRDPPASLGTSTPAGTSPQAPETTAGH